MKTLFIILIAILFTSCTATVSKEKFKFKKYNHRPSLNIGR